MSRRCLTFSTAAFVALFASTATAQVITVGPSDDFTKIEGAGPGDIVEIQPGTYQFRVFLSNVGTAANPIIIRAADPTNRPVWDLGGQNVEDAPGSYTGGDRGRGCWQVGGEHYEISGIVIKNCHTAGGNSAGIRTRDSQNVTVRHMLFQDNDVGFSGDGEGTLVEFSEFDGNGQPGSPPQHSNYIFGGSFTLRHSYVHDSVGGQNFHIRARDSVIEYNWIARSGNYEGDIMTGDDPNHTMLFRGNVVVGSSSPGNGSTIITLFNDQGTSGVTMDLTAVYNTFFVQAGSNPAVVSVRNDTMQSASVVFSNNIVVGTDRAFNIREPGTSNWTTGGTNNFFETGADVGNLTATVFGANPGFANAGSLDFTLAPGSPAIGAADTSVANGPNREYFENEINAGMFRWRDSANDLGAFESTTMGNGYGPYDDPGQPPPGPGGAGGMGAGGTAGSGPGGSGGSGTAGTGGTTSGTGGSGTAGSSSGTGGTGTAGTSSGSGGSNTGKSGSSDSGDDSGCGCRLPNAPTSSTNWWLPVALLAARRVKRRARTRAC